MALNELIQDWQELQPVIRAIRGTGDLFRLRSVMSTANKRQGNRACKNTFGLSAPQPHFKRCKSKSCWIHGRDNVIAESQQLRNELTSITAGNRQAKWCTLQSMTTDCKYYIPEGAYTFKQELSDFRRAMRYYNRRNPENKIVYVMATDVKGDGTLHAHMVLSHVPEWLQEWTAKHDMSLWMDKQPIRNCDAIRGYMVQAIVRTSQIDVQAQIRAIYRTRGIIGERNQDVVESPYCISLHFFRAYQEFTTRKHVNAKHRNAPDYTAMLRSTGLNQSIGEWSVYMPDGHT